MSSDIIERPAQRGFDEFKHVNEHGAEYWNARELQSLLGYGQWRSFENAIKKAVTSCKQSGNEPGYHFARARKMIDLPKGAAREVTDYHLSRFACYLIAQNGDEQQKAIDTHHQVGQEVREAIRRIGGTLPENIPPAEPIGEVKRRLKATPRKLQLEDQDAKGLAGKRGKRNGK